jgi:FtsH-binding integral membrane protein
MDMGTLGWIVTVILFGAVGWLIASRRQRPAGVKVFGLLLGLAVVGYFVGVSTTVFGVDDFRMHLNWIIVSGCVGGCLGLLVRNWRLGRLERA